MPVNPERPRIVDQFIAKLNPADPGFDPFVDFMSTLDNEQQEAIVKFMMARKASSLAPHWVTFAITATLIENVQRVATMAGTPVAAAIQRLESIAQNVGATATRIDTTLKALPQAVAGIDRQVRSAQDVVSSTTDLIRQAARQEIETQQDRWRQEEGSLLKLFAGLLAAVMAIALLGGILLGQRLGGSARQNGIAGAQIFSAIRHDVLINMLNEAKSRHDSSAIRYLRERLRK